MRPARGGQRTAQRDQRARERSGAAQERRARRSAARAARREQRTADVGTGVQAPGAASVLPGLPVGRPIPSFLIERFRIPPFLLSIYQAAGAEYGVRWEVLAAINEIETDYGRNLGVSSAGALGWMQFMPATWKQYGTDANDDGRRDPFNPVDAIFATARYLAAAGYAEDVRGAIFAYNHADWYVDSVLERAKLVSLLPQELVGALAGLTEGRFPVHAAATYASRRTTSTKGRRRTVTSQGSELRRQLDVLADPGSAVVAVQDGRIVRIGRTRALGRYVQLRDVWGNTYTYANLGSVAADYLVPKRRGARPAHHAAPATPKAEVDVAFAPARPAPVLPPRPGVHPAPNGPVPLDDERRAGTAEKAGKEVLRAGKPAPSFAVDDAPPGIPAPPPAPSPRPASPRPVSRSVAAPTPWRAPAAAAWPAPARVVPAVLVRAPAAKPDLPAPASPERSEQRPAPSRGTAWTPYQQRLLGGLRRTDVRPLRLHVGSAVVGGTVLGRIGGGARPHLRFSIKPAGKRTSRIDPTPILDGWRLLETTAVYRATGRSALDREGTTSVGRILLESKDRLVRRVLADPGIRLYACGRRDVAAGLIDRRVLAALAVLSEEGLKPTVSSLRCGHGYLTASGNVSEHTTGTAVDIAEINGTPVLGHQGPGSITETAIRKLLTFQGTMKAHQIISLMTVPGADNTLSLPDHADHLHVGWSARPAGDAQAAGTLGGGLRGSDWDHLMARLNVIENPLVRATPSSRALPVHNDR